MSIWRSVVRSNFFIKLKSWEYWPFGIVQFPAILYWIWLSFRERSFVFFSGSNPGIPMGGMFGESKFDVLKKIPRQYVPKTILISPPASVSEVLQHMQTAGLELPVIFKPDIGERGYLVKRIVDEIDIAAYLRRVKGNFLVQELLDLPVEFGVYYRRLPGEKHGSVVSLVGKEMLSVTGDGRSTLEDLILRNDRAKLQWEKLNASFNGKFQTIIPEGVKIELVSIGNHSMGTKFINANHLINENLSRTFDEISSAIPGFYYGRYDLRCRSVDDLYAGNFKVMELNGCGAEPAHIYDPDFSFWAACAVQLEHWDNIYRIARANRKNGFQYLSHSDALRYYRKFKSAVK